MSTAQPVGDTPDGDHVTRTIKRGQKPRPKQAHPKGKRTQSKAKTASPPPEDSQKLRAELNDLEQKFQDLSSSLKAESAFLRSKLDEGLDLSEVQSRMNNLQAKISGLRLQASNQYKQAAELRDQLAEATAGLEDVRAQLDEMHQLVRVRRLAPKARGREIVEGIDTGHLVAGVTGVGVGIASVSAVNQLANTSLRLHPLMAVGLFLTGMGVHEYKSV